MGLFDFLKKKQRPTSQEASEDRTLVSPEKEPFLGDLDKTTIIHKLLKKPTEQRDEAWSEKFLANIGLASFRCGDPQVITGPDGYPYFQLFLPEPKKEFECFVIRNMTKDLLLDGGLGVVINPGEYDADWVLSYGDILNYHLNQEFVTIDDQLFSKPSDPQTFEEGEEVHVGQPSENLLPREVRKLLAELFRNNGVDNAKILLLLRTYDGGASTSHDIAFNVTPADFSSEELYEEVMETIRWYLPRHYSYMSIDESVFKDDFEPL